MCVFINYTKIDYGINDNHREIQLDVSFILLVDTNSIRLNASNGIDEAHHCYYSCLLLCLRSCSVRREQYSLRRLAKAY